MSPIIPLHFRQAILHVNNQQYQLKAGQSNSFDEIFADFQQEDIEHGTRYSIFLHPKQDLVVRRLELQFSLQLDAQARILANGYQSWSATDLVNPSDGIQRLRSIAKRYVGLTGDEYIADIPRGKGYVHSWTYTFIEPSAGSKYLMASLNEKTGFTIFLYDAANAVLTVRKDMDDLVLSHSFPSLDFCILQGELTQILYDQWASLMDLSKPNLAPSIGWASGLSQGSSLSKESVLQSLNGFKSALDPIQDTLPSGQKIHFQIDDGWQNQVGDWLSPKPSFSGTMPDLVGAIKREGMIPGLWLSPWVATQHAEVFKKHPHWFLKDKHNKPLKIGWSNQWKGWYYALDFYDSEVRDHITGVFHVLLDQWGFELLKLDYLFAVCLRPPKGKTRGQVMHEALEFMRRLCGHRLMLANGVPLGSAIGLADYCRVCANLRSTKEQSLSAYVRHRERSNLIFALKSILYRSPLLSRFFMNDGDISTLQGKSTQLSENEQYTTLLIKALSTSILYTSDQVDQYSPEQMAEWTEAIALHDSSQYRFKEIQEEVYQISFEAGGQQCALVSNLTKKATVTKAGQKVYDLEAFESWLEG